MSCIVLSMQDSAALLRKQLCELHVRHSAYGKALDVFTLFHELPKKLWNAFINDWSRIIKKAIVLNDSSVTSRYVY